MTLFSNGHHDRTMFECVDGKLKYISGAQASTNVVCSTLWAQTVMEIGQQATALPMKQTDL